MWRPHVDACISELMNLSFGFPCQKILQMCLNLGPVFVLTVTFPFASCSWCGKPFDWSSWWSSRGAWYQRKLQNNKITGKENQSAALLIIHWTGMKLQVFELSDCGQTEERWLFLGFQVNATSDRLLVSSEACVVACNCTARQAVSGLWSWTSAAYLRRPGFEWKHASYWKEFLKHQSRVLSLCQLKKKNKPQEGAEVGKKLAEKSQCP